MKGLCFVLNQGICFIEKSFNLLSLDVDSGPCQISKTEFFFENKYLLNALVKC